MSIEDELKFDHASSSNALASLDDLDVVSWVNQILAEPTVSVADSAPARSSGLTDLDRRLTSLVGILDIASEETSALLERTIDDISRTTPRLTYDLHFMREGSLTLQSALSTVQNKSGSAAGDSETTAALERLHHLDRVRRNMQVARDVLREAESWSTLESEVTALLDEHKYEKAAERLLEASQSMVVFENTPEYEARRALMVSLQNQLEASLSSALVSAINTGDVDVCRQYFSIFSNIQRESEFRSYYYGSRRSTIVTVWQDAKLIDCDTTPTSPISTNTPMPTFSSFLPGFYSSLANLLNNERVSIASIFPDPQPTLSALLTSTLSALQPSLSQRLSTMSAYHGPTALTEIISAFKATEEFAVIVDKTMQKIGISVLSNPVASPDTSEEVPTLTRSERRRSNRMSISVSRRMNPNRASISGSSLLGGLSFTASEWEQVLFEPFVEFQTDYRMLEERFLAGYLNSILQTDTRQTDPARLLKERAIDVFSMAEDGIGRCHAFTHGYGVSELIKALDKTFKSFIDNSKNQLEGSRSTRRLSATTSARQEDLYDLDYTPENWAEIQSSLHLLEAAGTILERLVSFEGTLRAALVQISNVLKSIRNDPSGHHISGATRGELELLAQGALNTVELHQLLQSVEPQDQSTQPRGHAYLSPGASSSRPGSGGSSASLAIFLETRASISDFARTCQSGLQATILSPLRRHLAGYPMLSLWSGSGEAARGPNDLPVPTFSLSPSDVMQRVAEGLLNLPRLFEVYADDDALSFSLTTLPFLSAEFLRALQDHTPHETDDSTGGGTRSHSRRSPSMSLRTPPMPPVDAPPLPSLSPEAVASAWLSSLGLSLLTHFTADVLPRIPALSTAGAAQLVSDLGYLSNIVQALNVEHEDLELWRKYVEADELSLRKILVEGGQSDSVLKVVAKLKGINIG